MDHVFKAETNIEVISKITEGTHLRVQLGWRNKEAIVHACLGRWVVRVPYASRRKG